MKVLFVHQNLTGTTGESVESKEAIQSLLRQGITVGALYRRYDKPAIESPDGKYIDLGCFNFSLKDIFERINEFSPQVGHIKSCWTPFHAKAAWAMRRNNIPYILEPGGHFLPVHFTTRFAERPYGLMRKILKHGYQALVDSSVLRGAGAVRALSNLEARDLTQRYGVKSFALPLGINKEYYIDNPIVRSCSTPTKVRFLFVGRLDIFQKGLDLILNAVEILNSRGLVDSFEVILAGPALNKSDARLDTEINQRRIFNARTHPPIRGQEKIDLFQSSHVFLHPSRFEEMAKLPREVVATGLPVIASRESNFGDWAESEGFGLATDLSPQSLAECMEEFITDRAMIRSCSEAAINYAQRSSWDEIASKLIPEYHKLISYDDERLM
jgi:glycosyltransferase involved in cell wall biosynthesis